MLKSLPEGLLDEIIYTYDNLGTFSFDSKKQKIEFLYEQILSCISDFFVYSSEPFFAAFKYLLDTKNKKTGISEVSQFIPMTDENERRFTEFLRHKILQRYGTFSFRKIRFHQFRQKII